MDQLDLFDGGNLADEGMRAALKAASEPYKERFAGVLLELARSGEPFTSEDITDRVGFPNSPGTNRNNVVGALINAAATRRLIVRIGIKRARRPISHAAMLSLWKGL